MKQLETCKKCLNRAVSRKEGIVCGLTDAKPTFTDNCNEFELDPIQEKRVARYNREFNPKAVHKESAMKALMGGAPLLGIGLFLTILPLGSIIGVVGRILLISGIISVIYAIIKFFLIQEQYPEPTKKKNTHKKDDFEVY
ncbi:MAG: hypothetical protein HUJ25_07025 [Crocinitomicaceae bacterium]|nr:hypothetical protein [Crocinitomicaceae bacterium]